MNYFISDLHFGHENCLDFDARPFNNIEEHDAELIKRWNEKVTPDDDVYILGDISWKNVTETIKIFEQLNGRKHLIKGNHDAHFMKNKQLRDQFVEITDYKELVINEDGTSIVLSHYPILAYKNLFRGWKHLYGHVHSSLEWNMMTANKLRFKELYSKKDGRDPEDVFEAYNVGCMMPYMNYTPMSYTELSEAAKKMGY